MIKKIICLASALLGLSLSSMANTSTTVDTTLINKYIEKLTFFYENKQIDSVLAICDSILLLDSTLTDIYTTKANMLSAQNKLEEALAVNTKGLQFDPLNTDAIISQSHYLSLLSRNKEALAILDEAINKNPDMPSLYIQKLTIYGRMEDYENGYSTCEKILKIKDVDDYSKYIAHATIIRLTKEKSLDKAINAMLKTFNSNYYSLAYATKEYNARSIFDKGEKYKKLAFKAHSKEKLENKTICIDEYTHSDVIVQVYEYFDPSDAGSMKVQYEFRVFNKDTEQWMYNIRVEYITDIMGQYKSQMAVMATLSEDGFRTYWDTLSELKKTPYKKWMKFANKIIDNKLKVGSATLIGKDGESTISIDSDDDSEQK